MGTRMVMDRYGDMVEVEDCAIPTCELWAEPGSLFCAMHGPRALEEKARKETEYLRKETTRLLSLRDEKGRRRAAGRFRARIQSGDFPALFVGQTQQIVEEAGQTLALRAELGALRLAMSRALQEIDDPERMSLTVARLANAAARTAKSHHMLNQKKPAQRTGGAYLDDFAKARKLDAVLESMEKDGLLGEGGLAELIPELLAEEKKAEG